MNPAANFDAGLIARHVGPNTPPALLELQLFHGHMQLIASLMRAQTRLHDANYQMAVRVAVVGPAHQAVMDSARQMARFAAQAPGADTPDTAKETP